MRSIVLTALGGALTTLGYASDLKAAPVQIDYTGTIDSISNPNNANSLYSDAAVGDTYSATIVYDSEAGTYFGGEAQTFADNFILEYSVTINGETHNFNVDAETNIFQSIDAVVNSTEGGQINGFDDLILALADNRSSVAVANEAAVLDLDYNQFAVDDHTQFIVPDQGDTFLRGDTTFVVNGISLSGDVTSYTVSDPVVAVPTPAALGAGVLLLPLLLKRHSKQHE
ncbi:hypothetical protein JD969_15315 [Planctomycetota bacterium]|nr:hypothetical protein JD969_15315 [Planctomycetota bacterium]